MPSAAEPDARARLALLAGIEGDAEVLADRRDVTVVRVGDRAVKLHAPETDSRALDTRLELAAQLPDVFVAPIPFAAGRTATVADRFVSRWPVGDPVDAADPDAAPWTAAAHLLARLHATPPPAAMPRMGGIARLTRALRRIEDSPTPEAATVFAAHATLPSWIREAQPVPPDLRHGLTHGDWHLGQLVRIDSAWRLIDVDDLGVGPLVWDLARPAAWFAVGMLAPDTFAEFLDAYRSAGGCAVPHEDPWSVLDAPARALTVQAAAAAIAAAAQQNRPLDEVEELLIESCRGIVRVSKLP